MTNQTKTPAFRRLRGYAFDPSLSMKLATAAVNNLTYKVEWEALDRDEKGGLSYPCGEYIEIIDYDPASNAFYPPVDLDAACTGQDGLPPRVSDPQFHQQMVYAVVMTTIKNFERALGRKIQWSDRITVNKDNNGPLFQYVKRLRVYPHALRQANAYYNPHKKALLFGYFPAAPASKNLQMPGGMVYTCLSHDIIAHETTHAILDGLHRRYIDATHPDTRAFHEAFADIVALFQHFTFPEVLRHQIAHTRGNLMGESLLSQLAHQFGIATGSYGSLRDAIGSIDASGQWQARKPDPDDYDTKMEVHERGSILVAAVFDAFLIIYNDRVRSLIRLATGGTGILPEGELAPDLVDRLATAASKTAGEVLTICIRALDYSPHADITFGDYLRAIVTADADVVEDDDRSYRVAFIEAFQKRGIFAEGLRSISPEDLIYEQNPEGLNREQLAILGEFLRDVKEYLNYVKNREKVHDMTKECIAGSKTIHMGLHQRLNVKFIRNGADGFQKLTGMLFPPAKDCEKAGLAFSSRTQSASYEVDNLWVANRITPDDRILNHVIVTLAQRRGVRFQVSEDGEVRVDEGGFFVPSDKGAMPAQSIVFRGGCTMIFDLDSSTLRYVIKKDIDDRVRMIRQYKCENGLLGNEHDDTYFDYSAMNLLSGPFAFNHAH